MFAKAMTLAAALTSGLMLAPAPAAAQPFGYADPGYFQPVQGRRWRGGRPGWNGRRDFDRRYDDRRYRDRDDDRRGYGRRYRGRCRDSGTGGTIIGAIAGGLLGDAAVGRRGDGTAGAIAGAGIGALAGRAIDRDC